MGDDLVNDGILPTGGTVLDDEDPNAIESDDFLDDFPEEEVAVDASAAVAESDDDDDDPLEVDE